MTDINKINEEALENVTGGVVKIVNTGDQRDAVIRIAPGTSNAQIGSLKNGTRVNATGELRTADGRSWAKIDSPVVGWVAASIIGFPRY